MLELLEFWKNEELMLTLPAISAVEITSECVQVVVLSISVFLPTRVGLLPVEAILSVLVVVL